MFKYVFTVLNHLYRTKTPSQSSVVFFFVAKNVKNDLRAFSVLVVAIIFRKKKDVDSDIKYFE